MARITIVRLNAFILILQGYSSGLQFNLGGGG
jgi:hypothetical protein